MRIKMQDIHKQFDHNKVLRGVDITIEPGHVHALMGENGAGKSTLMNILTGLLRQDEGQVLIDGQERQFANPKEAEENGISFIHQELITWPEMTVLENLFMGKEIVKSWGICDNHQMRQKAEEVFRSLDIDLNLSQKMGDLSVGQQQVIEIAKSLLSDCSVLIMDEPTAALTEREIDKLFVIINQLKAKGVSIVYISHRMQEIFQISDFVTVMRDGRSIMTEQTALTSQEEVVRAMVGRDLEDYYPSKTAEIGPVVLEVNHLTSTGKFHEVDFQLHQGEILGVSGLMGAGRTEIMRAIFGLEPKVTGEVKLKGESLDNRSPQKVIEKGIGFVTENRKEEGLILDFSIRDNISLTALNEFSKQGLVNRKTEGEFVKMLIDRLGVKTSDMELPVQSLSGGNQQKVVLAKWIAAGSQVLILDEPTRGVDVGAKRDIYLLMNELAKNGVAIIMVSSDLPEIIGVSDRVLVVHEGRIAADLKKENLTEELIMTYATGGK